MKRTISRLSTSIVALVLALVCILPFVANSTERVAADTTSSKELIQGVALITDNEALETPETGYIKTTFIINGAEGKDVYIKENDKMSLSLTDNTIGMILRGVENGETVTSSKTIYIRTYSYENTLNLKKEVKDLMPDSDGYYTIDLTASSKNMPSLLSEVQNVSLIIDCSLSMACDIESDVDSDKMAKTYDRTRWKVMMDSIDTFLDMFYAANINNTASLVIYNSDASIVTFNGKSETTEKSDIMNELSTIFNENIFTTTNPSNSTGINVDKIKKSGLATGTNIADGLDKAYDALENVGRMGSSVVLFTDGVANRPRDDEKEFKNCYYNGNKLSDAKYLFAAYKAQEHGQKLTDAGADIYSVALVNGTEEDMNYVKISMGNITASYTVDNKNKNFDFTSGGYAKKFYQATDEDSLANEFKAIMKEMTSLPFETSIVTDTLDSHFELVEGQSGVTDNKNGTFTVRYDDSVSSVPQTKSVKVKAKGGYAGLSYTNNGCVFNGKVNDLTYIQNFADEPVAIILPHASDDEYTVKQNTTLNAETVKKNDKNILVKSLNNVSVSLGVEKITDTAHGKLVFNENDGTFTYTPDKDFYGKDSFKYNVVLTVGDKVCKAEATVTIKVNKSDEPSTKPSEPETKPSEPVTKSTEPVTKPSTPETKSETVAETVSSNEVGADNDYLGKNDAETVDTADRSNMMIYAVIVLMAGAVTVFLSKAACKKER